MSETERLETALRDAADYAARVLDLWLTGDEDFTEATVREAIARVRATDSSSPSQPIGDQS